MKLRPYQDLAADFVFERDRSMILAPVGAGKTAIALTAMQEYIAQGVVTRWLVIAPVRVAKEVWPDETKKWSWLSLNLAVGTPHRREAMIMQRSDIAVINYENLQWLADKFPDLSKRFDGVVFDELTRLKNPSGKRFKAFLNVVKGIDVRIGLTGSFTSNGLEDVFGQCKIIDQTVLGRSKGAYLQEYFILTNKDFGEWTPRKGSLEKVMERVKPVTFVLDNGDYKDSLPPLHIVPLYGDMKNREPYEKMKHDFAVEFPTGKAVAANGGVVTGKLTQMACGWVYETHKTPNPDKPGKFIVTQTPVWFDDTKFELLDELLEENQRAPTLIWYWYQEELAELQRRYPDGETLDAPDAIARWNRGEIERLFVHPSSAGHGLNLQGQSKMVFLTLPWSLELFEQAIGRLHRSGQRHDVWCYLLLMRRTIDELIWGALRDKRDLSDIAIEALK